MRIKLENNGIGTGIGTKFFDDEGNDISDQIDAKAVDIRIRPNDVVTATIKTFSHGIDVEVLKNHAFIQVGPIPYGDEIVVAILDKLEKHEGCMIYADSLREGNRANLLGTIYRVLVQEARKKRL